MSITVIAPLFADDHCWWYSLAGGAAAGVRASQASGSEHRSHRHWCRALSLDQRNYTSGIRMVYMYKHFITTQVSSADNHGNSRDIHGISMDIPR